jgi:hypothetical protein
MRQPEIRDLWEYHPRGDHPVGGLAAFTQNYETFFREYDLARFFRAKASG